MIFDIFLKTVKISFLTVVSNSEYCQNTIFVKITNVSYNVAFGIFGKSVKNRCHSQYFCGIYQNRLKYTFFHFCNIYGNLRLNTRYCKLKKQEESWWVLKKYIPDVLLHAEIASANVLNIWINLKKI